MTSIPAGLSNVEDISGILSREAALGSGRAVVCRRESLDTGIKKPTSSEIISFCFHLGAAHSEKTTRLYHKDTIRASSVLLMERICLDTFLSSISGFGRGEADLSQRFLFFGVSLVGWLVSPHILPLLPISQLQAPRILHSCSSSHQNTFLSKSCFAALSTLERNYV